MNLFAKQEDFYVFRAGLVYDFYTRETFAGNTWRTPPQGGADPQAHLMFEQLTVHEQQVLLEFCMGNRSLKITYDPFFRNIMHPVKHPDRLNRFLSQVLEQKVAVKGILPREGVRLSVESSLMIMDLLVELSDGSLVNVEMQKVGYHFPMEHSFCYGADLLVRQYDRIHAELGKKFTYQNKERIFFCICKCS